MSTAHEEWKHCNRCGNVLMGNEQCSDTCNRCLDLGYASMTDDEYAHVAPDVDAYERLYDTIGAEKWHAMTVRERVHVAGLDSGRFMAYLRGYGEMLNGALPGTSNHDRLSNFLDLFHPGMSRERRSQFIRDCGLAVLLSMLLTIPAHAAPPTFELPLHPPDTYLAGCAIVVHDDGSRLAECPEDGAALIWDADGQRFVNEAGAPIRAAGWYVLE